MSSYVPYTAAGDYGITVVALADGGPAPASGTPNDGTSTEPDWKSRRRLGCEIEEPQQT